MSTEGHFFRDGGTLMTAYQVDDQTLYEDVRGQLVIGYVAPSAATGDFLGAPLGEILGKGKRTARQCYPGLAAHVTPLNGFWDDYLQRGRCAIDKAHELSFPGPARFTYRDGVRQCNWCGESIGAAHDGLPESTVQDATALRPLLRLVVGGIDEV